MKYLILPLLVLIAFTSCEEPKTQSEIDDEHIQNYLNNNNIDATYHQSGMYYVINEAGSNEHPTLSDSVQVSYKGYFTNDEVFEETVDTSITFVLGKLIYGWQIAIPMLGKGGSGTFFLPSYLAYGTQQISANQPNYVLIFDIELIDFN
ncbi:MAG: FKBP-type peptidyl-prolyl cis-trans isomerase [Bacteroidales bacterium]|nr:FKBP-type peptidyl-prolyl cis-trans isomerase [Bacteroidales bacterium]